MSPKTAPAAFVGKSGKLYVRVRLVEPQPDNAFTTRTAVYPSVDAYNKRSSIPEYEEIKAVWDDFDKPVTIDPVSLTIALH